MQNLGLLNNALDVPNNLVDDVGDLFKNHTSKKVAVCSMYSLVIN